MKRVAIIGAGGGGLCTAKHLLSYAGLMEPIIFEQSKHVGGTWVYEELKKKGEEPFSSMYKNLRYFDILFVFNR